MSSWAEVTRVVRLESRSVRGLHQSVGRASDAMSRIPPPDPAVATLIAVLQTPRSAFQAPASRPRGVITTLRPQGPTLSLPRRAFQAPGSRPRGVITTLRPRPEDFR